MLKSSAFKIFLKLIIKYTQCFTSHHCGKILSSEINNLQMIMVTVTLTIMLMIITTIMLMMIDVSQKLSNPVSQD